MNWKIILGGLVIFTCLSLSNVYADDGIGEYAWHDKLSRGAVNVVTCPVEIVRGIDLTTKSSNVAQGWTVGLVKGLAGTVMRLGSGAIDIVTFPFDWPKDNKGPIMDPKYAWQDWHGEYLE